jgi:hypothetical protein
LLLLLQAPARLEAVPPQTAEPLYFPFFFCPVFLFTFFFSRGCACLLFFFPVFCPRRYFSFSFLFSFPSLMVAAQMLAVGRVDVHKLNELGDASVVSWK